MYKLSAFAELHKKGCCKRQPFFIIVNVLYYFRVSMNMKSANTVFKNIIYFFAVCSLPFVFTACEDTVKPPITETVLIVENTQRALLVYNGSTNTTASGSLANPVFDQIIAQKTNNLIAANLQLKTLSYLIPLYFKSATNDTPFIAPFITEFFHAVAGPDTTAVPTFWMNNSYIGNASTTAADINFQFNKNITGATPIIGVAATAKPLANNNIEIKLKAKAFDNLSGDYHLSVMVIEKAVDGYQAGATGSFITHKQVIRGSAVQNAIGIPIAFSSNALLSNPAKNSEIEKTINFQFEATRQTVKDNYPSLIYWDYLQDNTGVIVSVWKKTTNPNKPFEFVNAVWADVK